VFWGLLGNCFYNDAYAVLIGLERHPDRSAFPPGKWEELWELIGPQTDYDNGWSGRDRAPARADHAPWARGRRLLYLQLQPDQRWHDGGGVGAVPMLCSETTIQVWVGRQMALERERQRLMLQQMPGFAALLSGPIVTNTSITLMSKSRGNTRSLENGVKLLPLT
jgi:hypothetical protein